MRAQSCGVVGDVHEVGPGRARDEHRGRPETLALLGVGSLDLRIEVAGDHAHAVAGGAAGGDCGAAHHEHRAARGGRAGLHPDRVAVVLEGLAGPRLAEHTDDLVDALAAAVVALAEHLVLELAVADREVTMRRPGPARLSRVAMSSASRIGSHSGATMAAIVIGMRSRRRGDRGADDERRRHVAVVGDVVLAERDRRESLLVGPLRLLDHRRVAALCGADPGARRMS